MARNCSVQQLNDFGRVRLSRSFFMRDMLHSEIAEVHGLTNAPDDSDLAIAAGTRLCEELLEPLQERWVRLAIRSAYPAARSTRSATRCRRRVSPATIEKVAAHHI